MTRIATQDPRLAALKTWLEARLGSGGFSVEPASADASFRRYFRVYHGGDSHIAMDAPPEREDCRPFVRICERLHAYGLNTPRILERDLAKGFLLLDDLGGTQYLAALDAGNAESLYGDALDALLRMQTRVPAADLAPYDRDELLREMMLFVDWFLQRHLQVTIDEQGRSVIHDTFEQLIDNALEQPRVFVHRDYHSRNLMVRDTNNPGILDFQDAVNGPVTYDLVSLLRDCYIAWPEADIKRWVHGYHGRLREAGLVDVEIPVFQRWFDWMGVQRHLKAIGIFARLNHRDGKPGYMNDIPRAFGYVSDVCARYPELEPFARLMQRLSIAGRLEP